MKTNKIRLVIILGAIGTFVLIAVILVAALLVNGTIKLLKQNLVVSLDNPYVNQNFEGWKRVSIHDDFSVEIPQEWEIIEDHNRIKIVKVNEQIAEGLFVEARIAEKSLKTDSEYIRFRDEIAKTEDYESSFQSFYATNLGVPVDYGTETFRDAEGNTSRFYRLMIKGINNRNGESNYYEFCFPADDEANDEAMIEILEAIAYSYRVSRGRFS